jgi:hypothetical protein
MKLLLPLVLLMACKSAPPPVSAPTSMPATVLDALCANMRSEGIASEVAAVKTTEPLITRASMIALATAGFYHGKDDPARFAAALAASTPKMDFPTNASRCEMRAIDAAGEARSDVMLLQVSSPFVNPFTRGSVGILARISLANEAAQWYWLPIILRNGVWYAGRPLPLSVTD